jgi:hypothetical protein
MAKITYHIEVREIHFKNRETYRSSATTTPLEAKFKKNDEVRFESDYPGTVIVYHNATPFKNLKAGEYVDLPKGGFVLKDLRRRDYHFDCGEWQTSKVLAASASETSSLSTPTKTFVPWPGGGNTPHH